MRLKSSNRIVTPFLVLVCLVALGFFVQWLSLEGDGILILLRDTQSQRGKPSTGQAIDICARFVPSSTSVLSSSAITTPSTSSVWKELKHQILNASYLPLEHAPNVAFRGWIDTLFHFYSAERLRRSISNPASTNAGRHILKILSDYPATKEPLRVLVMGGSVTAGHGCDVNPLGLSGGPKKNVAFKDCAWAARLEYLMNHVFFGGERAVQVSNELWYSSISFYQKAWKDPTLSCWLILQMTHRKKTQIHYSTSTCKMWSKRHTL
jgi:hypothetical protein